MSSIKVNNFGPIIDGFKENDGFINIDKVMVFIGGQGSGKSTIVKLISTISWLEKALFKEIISISDIVDDDAFKDEWCEYQSIHNYFKFNTYIEYRGLFMNLIYDGGKTKIELKSNSNYKLPKITYIPAERNFLSVLEDLENVKGLPKFLQWTLDEHIRACRSQKVPIPIGINNISFEYNKETKETILKGNNFNNLKLSEASSGIQSVLPLVNVMYYLEFFLNNKKANSIENLSFLERERFDELEKKIINNSKLSAKQKEEKRRAIIENFLPQFLFTIIEELEQNLFPESQKSVLFDALIRLNNKIGNHLILTTHSPYIIAYITLAMKAGEIKDKIKEDKLLKRLQEIIPLEATIDSNQTGVYQIDEIGGIISILTKNGIIRDNNYLNNTLEETNEIFNKLLDIEEAC